MLWNRSSTLDYKFTGGCRNKRCSNLTIKWSTVTVVTVTNKNVKDEVLHTPGVTRPSILVVKNDCRHELLERFVLTSFSLYNANQDHCHILLLLLHSRYFFIHINQIVIWLNNTIMSPCDDFKRILSVCSWFIKCVE